VAVVQLQQRILNLCVQRLDLRHAGVWCLQAVESEVKALSCMPHKPCTYQHPPLTSSQPPSRGHTVAIEAGSPFVRLSHPVSTSDEHTHLLDGDGRPHGHDDVGLVRQRQAAAPPEGAHRGPQPPRHPLRARK
jgi:hypothetical protein